MTEDRFWELIHESRRDFDPRLRDGNMDRQRARLERLLAELPTEDVLKFNARMAAVFDLADRRDLWAAADQIASGCSDDGFDYFRYWLISMGRRVYEDALADPNGLAAVARAPGIEDIFFEEFSYAADNVLEARGVRPTE